MVNRAYRSAGGGWTHEADLLDGQRTDPATLRDTLAAGTTVLVALDAQDHRLRGCVSVEPKPGEPGTWYLGMLTVMPGHQAAGLGSFLLAAAERFACEAGAQRFEMTVISVRGELIAWYERRGYVATGRTAPFPYGDERFGKPRRPDLAFVVLAKAAP